MVKKHEEETLISLKDNVRRWHLEEFGSVISDVYVINFLKDLIDTRTKSFLMRRVNHLTDEDLVNFKTIWENQTDGVREEKETANPREKSRGDSEVKKFELSQSGNEVAKSPGVAKTSKTSPSNERKRI